MKSLILALSVAVALIGFLPVEADAKRLGGGGSSGMQRSLPSRAPDSVPARPPQAAPTPAPAPTGVPAAAPRRSWMGPIAGLAAGLGIGALMSHFGFGAGFGNLITMVLLALVAFAVIRFLMRRFAGNTPMAAGPGGMPFAAAGQRPAMSAAGAGSGWNGGSAPSFAPQGSQGSQSARQPQSPLGTATRLPAGFDAAGFERIAKMIFIRMQTANDRADLNDLRNFTTPEMYATVRLELQERGSQPQETDVVRVDAEVLEVVTEADRQIVSVRFHGLIRESQSGPTAPFDEVWHLLKPADGSREWAIAGIQQTQPA